jgi:hypothetical protein
MSGSGAWAHERTPTSGSSPSLDQVNRKRSGWKSAESGQTRRRLCADHVVARRDDRRREGPWLHAHVFHAGALAGSEEGGVKSRHGCEESEFAEGVAAG